MLEVRKLSFAYDRDILLRDISFVVSPGEIIGLVGANGVGKSTLLKILATIIMPQSGEVLLEGRDVVTNPYACRMLIGYMPELPILYEDMTVKSYLRFRARLKGEPEKRIRRRIAEAAEICHVEDLFAKSIRTLSFGQKKRLALADAILLRPRLLLLDDCYAGLDAPMRDVVGKMIAATAAFSSVIVSGHEIADMIRWATRIVVLKEGEIAGSLSVAGVDHEQLKQRILSLMRGVAK